MCIAGSAEVRRRANAYDCSRGGSDVAVAKEFAKAFYNSKAWLDCRAGYIASVHGLCERCGEAGWIVHHKIILTPMNINDPEVTLNWENLEYLCQDCHNREHHSEEKDVIAEGLAFDSDGNIIQVVPP